MTGRLCCTTSRADGEKAVDFRCCRQVARATVCMMLSLGTLIACTPPPIPSPSPIATPCRAPEPAMMIGEGDRAVRNTYVFPTTNNGQDSFQGQTCVVSDEAILPPGGMVGISGHVGSFTRQGELFSMSGNGTNLTQPQNNPPGTPRWAVPLVSNDPADGQYISRLGQRTVVQVTETVTPSGGQGVQTTRAWFRRIPSPPGVAEAPETEIAGLTNNCLRPGSPHHAAPQVRDVHLILSAAGNGLTMNACVSAPRGYFLNGVRLTAQPYTTDGSLLTKTLGNFVQGVTPLRDAPGAHAGTVVLLRDGGAVDPADAARLAPRAKLTLTYAICTDATFTRCQPERKVVSSARVTLDRVTLAHP